MESNSKIIEKLVITQVRPKIKNSENKPENEQINTAVQKVLQGYDWTLVPAQIKWVFYFVQLLLIKITAASALEWHYFF